MIKSRITLDGTTQPGYTEGSPIINIEANTYITTCFSAYGVDELTIKGFSFHNFIACGISLENCNYSTISDNIITLDNSNYLRSKIGLVRVRLLNCTNINVYNNILNTSNDGSPIHGPANYGVAIYNSKNCIIGAVLNSNIIEECATGIMLDNSQNIRLTQNKIYGGISSILLNNSSNNYKREPFLLNYNNGILNGVAQANDVVEVFGSDDEDDATAYLGTVIADGEGKWSLETVNNYTFFTATATDTNNNTSELCKVGTTNSLCSIPYNLTSTPGINTTHTLSWETDNPEAEFQIAVGKKGISPLENEWMFAYTTVTSNSISLSGFDENTVYEFYVQELCDAGVGHFVGPYDFNFINVAIPETTRLTDEFCGATVYSDDIIEAIQLSNVIEYKFLIMNENTGDELEIESTDNFISFPEIVNEIESETYLNIAVKGIYENMDSGYGENCTVLVLPEEDHKPYADGKIIIRLNSDMKISYSDTMQTYPIVEIEPLITRYGITKISKLFKFMEDSSVNYPHVIHYNSMIEAEEIMSEFNEISFVKSVGYVPVYSYYITPNDLMYDDVDFWHLNKISAESAWGIHQGAGDVIVAILDNGFNTTHEDLINNIWINSGEIDGNGIDDDDNGFVDDYHGYDVGDNDGNPHINTSNGVTFYGHGTHVAGIAGAETNNLSGVASISYGTQLMLVKNSSDTGYFDHEIAIASLEYLVNNGIDEDVVNMSWGAFDGDDGLNQEDIDDLYLPIETLFNNDIILVAAVGNNGLELGNGLEYYPSGFSEVIAVGATNSDDLLAIQGENNTTLSSNYGTSVDVMAPGVDIWSTMSGTLNTINDVYLSSSGTSMATPLVTGLCALMRSYKPDATVVDIRDCLISTCDPIDAINEGYEGLLGSGRVNAYEAIRCLMSEEILAAHFSASSQTSCESEPVTLYDESIGSPISWEWSVNPFDGVVFTSSNTVQNPDIIFNNPGHYDISLTITDINGNEQSIVYYNYIFIQNPQVQMVHSNHFCLDDGNIGFCLDDVTMNSLDVCNGSTQTITLYFNGEPPFNAVVTDGVQTYDVNPTFYPCAFYPEYNFRANVNVVVTDEYNTFTILSLENNVCALNSYENTSLTFTVHECCPNLLLDGDFEDVTEIPDTRTDLELETDNHRNEYRIQNNFLANSQVMSIDGPTEEQVVNAGNIDEHLLWASEVITVSENTDYILSLDNTTGTFCRNDCATLQNEWISIQRTRLLFQIINPNTNEVLLDERVYYPSTWLGSSRFWMTNNFSWYSENSQDIIINIYQVEEYGPTFYDYSLDNISLRAVNENAPFVSNIMNSSNASSISECDGYASVVASGGHELYVYEWSNGYDGSIANNLCVGEYEVTVTDMNLCNSINNVTIEDNSNVNITIEREDVSCFGFCDGSATVHIVGGTEPYTYLWSNSQGTSSIHNLCSGDYEVTISDVNGVSNVAFVTIHENDQLIAGVSSVINVSCFGYSNGQATINTEGGTGTYSYLWNDSEMQTGETATELSAWNYNVIVTDNNNCSTTVSVDITEPPLLSASITNLTNQICTTPGSATVEGSGGTPPYTYNWPSNAGGVNNNSANELYQNNYIVTVIDTNNCETQIDVNIIDEGSSLNVNSVVHQNPNCYGDENGEIDVSVENGIPDFTINWVSSSTTISNYYTLINSLSAGTYYFTVTDANGCTGESTTTLINNPPVTATISTYSDVTCYGAQDGTATVIADGGVAPYTYLWDDPDDQTTPTASELSGGTYNVTVTDENGCEEYTSVTIWESTNIKPSIDEIIHISCYGECDGSATASATGGVPPYTFDWGDPDEQTGDQAINLCAGNYSLTVTDSHGCTATTNAIITQNPELTATITSSTISCYGSNNGEATVTATGGDGNYTYLWSSDAQATETANNLAPGTHSVTVYDGNLCEAYADVTIGQNPEISASITDFENCVCYENLDGYATVAANGGVGSYTYQWDDEQNSTTQTVSNLHGGIYNVTATDINGCEAYASVTIGGPTEEFIASAEFTNIDCFGGTSEVTITAAGGTGPYSGTGTFSESAGTYSYTVTDANGCTTAITITIIEPSELEIPSFSTNDISCYGYSNGILMINYQGGTPNHSFSIEEGVWQESAIFNSLFAGTYIVTVQDANGCSVESDPIVINQPEEIAIIYDITDNSCSGNCTGEITAAPSGGTGDFTYKWNYDDWQYPVYTQGISDLCDGTYYLTVAEANNPDCLQTDFVIIESENATPLPPQFDIPTCLYINNTFQFTDNANSDQSLIWTWTIGDVTILTNSNTINYEFPDYGYYWISVKVENEECGSESTTPVLVFVNPDICSCDNDPMVGGDIEYDYPNGINIDGNGPFVLPVQNAGTPQTIRVSGDIVITPTNHLILEENLTIEFAPNSRIIVMNDAELIFRDNVTLTSVSEGSCKNNMWQGIEVWGDNDNIHDIDRQGLLSIEGSISNNYENVNINNAHIGILLGARNMNHILDPQNYPEPFDVTHSSGLIIIDDANVNFENNGIGIKFTPREPMAAIGALISGNQMKGCHFKTNLNTVLNDENYSMYSSNSYPNQQNPWAGYANPYQRTDVGIYANGIKGLDIENCTFENMQYGILSYDAKYNVYNSIFNKAIYGIKCENTSSSFLASHEISGCFFDNIPGFIPSSTSKTLTAAIHIRAGYLDYIHDNTFGYSTSIQKFNHFGIVTSSSSKFEITENEFNNFNRGIVTTNSGSNGGYIGAGMSDTDLDWKGNIFNNSWRSITTQSHNQKLRLKCNTSDNNTYDADAFDVNYYNTGELANQGSATINPHLLHSNRLPAGNEFYPDDEFDYKTIKTNSSYVYYRHLGPDEVIPISDPTGQSYINIDPTNAYNKQSNSRACPDPYWGLHIDDVIELPELEISHNNLIMTYPFNTLNGLRNTTDSLKTILEDINNNLDDGRTYELLNDIYGNTSSGRLKNKLISCSPLSDTVIYAILTEYPLSHGNFKNVMQLNLPVNKSQEDLLYTILLELPEGISKQLIALQAYNPNSNSPGSIEQQIKDMEIETQLLYNRLVRLLTDTSHNRAEDAIRIVKTNETVPAYKTLTGTYISVKEYELASNELVKIPIDNQANEDFAELNELLLSYYTQEKSLYSLDSADIAFLYELAYRCPENIASANAQSILNMLYREEFDECPPLLSIRNAAIYDAHLNAPEEDNILLLGDNYPDPANDYTIIPYNLGEYETGTINIIDQLGRVVQSYNVNNFEKELNVNTVKLEPGIYSYTIRTNDGFALTKKFAIYR